MTVETEQKTEKNGQAMVKYEPNAIVGNQSTLKGLLHTDAMQEAIRELAPKHLKPEKLVRMILSAASRNPTLLQCTSRCTLCRSQSSTSLPTAVTLTSSKYSGGLLTSRCALAR